MNWSLPQVPTFDELDSGDTATVTVDYTLSDDEGASDTGQVTITVSGVNDAPVAVDESDSTGENSDLTVDVLANDTDVDGDDSPVNFSLDAVSINSVTGLTGGGMGTVSEVNDELVFAPGTDFDELDSGDTVHSHRRLHLSDDEARPTPARSRLR